MDVINTPVDLPPAVVDALAPVSDTPVRAVVRPRTVFALQLDDPRFGGLQIKVRSQSFREWTAPGASIMWPGDEASEEDKNLYMRAIAQRFVSFIVSWNLTDENGVAEPVSVEALLDLDRQIVLDLFDAWQAAQRGQVARPLDKPSSGGDTSLADSIPTDGL